MERSQAVAAVFEPVQPPSTFEETVERLGTAIRLGLLEPGAQLPPERELAERLDIARSTLRQAITALVQSGHLYSVRGRGGGTFVTDTPPLDSAEPVPIGEWHARVDWRMAVETGAVALAAERIGSADVERLSKLADRMDQVLDDFTEYRRTDVHFHLGLAEATGVPQIVASMTEAQAQMTDLIAHIPHPAAVLNESNRQHRRLLAAVARGDVDRATRCVREHVRGTEHILAGLLPGHGEDHDSR